MSEKYKYMYVTECKWKKHFKDVQHIKVTGIYSAQRVFGIRLKPALRHRSQSFDHILSPCKELLKTAAGEGGVGIYPRNIFIFWAFYWKRNLSSN